MGPRMWNLFKKKPLLTDEDYFFQIECYKWLLRNFGTSAFKETELVLPKDEYFRVEASTEEEKVGEIFNAVRSYSGLSEWPCRLIRQEPAINPKLGDMLLVQGAEQSPAGTFSYDDENGASISYDPELVSNPTKLIATFAHELAHYLTSTAEEDPPGGWDNWEFATDLGAVFLGFGIFLCNSSFEFTQHSDEYSQGWSSSRTGYLSEAELSFALAIFLKLKNIDLNSIDAHLDRNISKLVSRAMDELEGSEGLNSLHQYLNTDT